MTLAELKAKYNAIAKDMRALNETIGDDAWTDEQRSHDTLYFPDQSRTISTIHCPGQYPPPPTPLIIPQQAPSVPPLAATAHPATHNNNIPIVTSTNKTEDLKEWAPVLARLE